MLRDGSGGRHPGYLSSRTIPHHGANKHVKAGRRRGISKRAEEEVLKRKGRLTIVERDSIYWC